MQCPPVTIAQGTLVGLKARDLDGKIYYKFLGIPYAKPPLGKLRFKAPRPPKKWTGTYEATQHGNICYQCDLTNKENIYGSEDCLFINVYTNRLPSHDGDKHLRPVMFYIHGGDFVYGSGNENGYFPRLLMEENVVVVTFNYRLGLYGFLNFEDPSLDIPGNAGFKDQVMALRWVRNNIRQFGGDPKNVTIFGESAGAISVHLLVLSPMSKGLFRKAIAQNGSYLSLGARGTKGSGPLVKLDDFKGADDKTIYNRLMDLTAHQVFLVQTQIVVSLIKSKTLIRGKFGIMGYVIEENSTEPFLDEEPEKIISSGKFNQVPFMIGYTTGQGLLVRYAKAVIGDQKLLIPGYFGYYSDSQKEAVAATARKFYYKHAAKNSLSTEERKLLLVSDCRFIIGIHGTVASHLKTSKAPIYFFRSNGDTDRPYEGPGEDEIGAALYQIFGVDLTPSKVASFRIFDLWTLFAKLKHPWQFRPKNVVWTPASLKKMELMNVTMEINTNLNLEMMSKADHERVYFWRRIFHESPGARAGVCCGLEFEEKF